MSPPGEIALFEKLPNKGHTNVEKTQLGNKTPRADPGQFHHK